MVLKRIERCGTLRMSSSSGMLWSSSSARIVPFSSPMRTGVVVNVPMIGPAGRATSHVERGSPGSGVVGVNTPSM